MADAAGHQAGLFVGDRVVVGPGAPNEEQCVVAALGSSVAVAAPLLYGHAAGEAVVLLHGQHHGP